MVRINSVRQPIAAPQEPIMGGALQGLSSFANNFVGKIDKKEAAAQKKMDDQNKLNLSLLTAYANQNRTITPDASGGLSYNGQNYDVGNANPNMLDQIRGMRSGLIPMTPEFKMQEATSMVNKALNTGYTPYTELLQAKKFKEASLLKENMLMMALDRIPKKAKSNNWLKNIFSKKSVPQVIPQGLQKPDYVQAPDGEKINIPQEDWDAASPDEQQALLDAYGL